MGIPLRILMVEDNPTDEKLAAIVGVWPASLTALRTRSQFAGARRLLNGRIVRRWQLR